MSYMTHHHRVHQTCGLCPCYVHEESNDQRMDAHVSAGIVCVCICMYKHVLPTLCGLQFTQLHCGDAKALWGQDASPHHVNHYI